jgi:hypothetical protein
MDVEGYEWGIMDNMMETGVLKHIRQYALEYHLFSNFPLIEEYVYIYKVKYTLALFECFALHYLIATFKMCWVR